MDEKTVFQPAPGGSVRPGVRLNGIYEIERLIAEGGMGEVYKGFNIQTGDPVAIKMIRPEMSRNPDALALFRREASTLHNLQHEAIVRYFVFSVDPELQRAYLAMEYVDGPSLSKHLAQGPMPLEDVDLLRRRVGSALDAAHRLGVVHRDISSDNFILPDGDVRKAKVIDFGIARSHRPGEATIIGDGFAGKYNYVSPEQLGLAGGEVTFKSDIYSFGLVLAEAIRGRPIDMSGSQVDVIEKRRKVPDLSEIPAMFRPLLQSMLQPGPADRPPSMAAVAAWDLRTPDGSPPTGAGAKAAARPESSRASSGGRLAATLGALIVLASIGGTAYVFRDDLRAWLKPAPTPIPSVSPSPTPSKPPPLPPATPTPAASPTLEPTPSPTPSAQTPTVEPSPTPTTEKTPPRLPDLLDELSPRAPQSLVALPTATVGKAYLGEIPAFADPGGKGLRLRADPSPPEGLTFQDHGDGSSEISGAPTRAGASTFQVVATNHKGKTAQTSVTISVVDQTPIAPPTPSVTPVAPPKPSAARPPAPSQPSVTLEGAIVGQDYSADLPPFRPGGDPRGLALRPVPNPPEGLTFADSGGGFSQLSGRPAKAGSFAFDVVATSSAGLTAKMSVAITVAPAPRPTPKPTATPTPTSTVTPTATATPAPAPTPSATSPRADAASSFLRAYDGGSCFLARPLGLSGDPKALQGIGADKAAFQRFEAAYKREVGVEPQISAKLIVPPECPALELLRLSEASAAAAPHVDLVNLDVGSGRPLAGAVRGIAGRRLVILVVDNDGDVHRIPFNLAPSGDAASFSAPLSGDASSIGPPQLLLAIVSDGPFSALEAFRPMAATDLVPKLSAEWTTVGASAAVEFFKLTK